MGLTPKQLQILEAIVFLMRKGELPTVREVGALVGLRSSATVSKHLEALKKARAITTSGKSRGIRIRDPELLERLLAGSLPEPGSAPQADPVPARTHVIQVHRPQLAPRPAGVPLVGAIAAGRPVSPRWEDFQSASDSQGSSFLAIDPRMFAASGDLVAMQVEGDSMVGAGILDGDYVVIRRQDEVEDGEVAAVFIDGEGTLKRLYTRSRRAGETDPSTRSDDGNRSVRLEAANERFEPMVITEENRKEVIVFGKYVGLVRGDLRIL